jgi:hypothetical protein
VQHIYGGDASAAIEPMVPPGAVVKGNAFNVIVMQNEVECIIHMYA